MSCRLACKCNQGLHQVWMTKLNSSYAWQPLNDTLVWTSCESTSAAPPPNSLPPPQTLQLSTCRSDSPTNESSGVSLFFFFFDSTIGVPLVFGQILPYTTQPETSYAITYGIRAAFEYLGANPPSSNAQNLTLITLNSDSYVNHPRV